MILEHVVNPRWEDPDGSQAQAVNLLEEQLSLPTVLCRLLVARGYQDPDRAKRHLRLSLNNLEDPKKLAGIAHAAQRLKDAIVKKERILVHGDYDVDGIVSTALLTRWIRKLGGDCIPFVPDRLKDGYDFGAAGLRQALTSKAKLIVTVDSGIRAHVAVSEAKDSGIDVVITDHHTPGDSLPDAISVVNPNRSDCEYGNKALCGAGVVYRLCEVLAAEFDIPSEDLRVYLDLVALATIADVVPLTKENRTFVRFGMAILNQSENCGLRALINRVNKDGATVTAGHLAFQVAPRINAAGRMGEAKNALRLLMTDNMESAKILSLELESENSRRRKEESAIMEQVVNHLSENFDPEKDFGVVLSGNDWHPGVIGIIASRVVELINRPTVVISTMDDAARGSARSISGFDLLSALSACGRHLEKFGGHRAAAGLTLLPSELDAFRRAFNLEVKKRVNNTSLRPTLKPDLEIQLSDINQKTFQLLSYFGPFGISNPTPLFLIRNLDLVGSARKVGTNHLRLRVRKVDREFDAIGFNLTGRISPENLKGPLDIVCKLRENSYRGISKIELQVLDVRLSAGQHSLDGEVYS